MIDLAVHLSTLPHTIGAAFMEGLFVVRGMSATELGGLYFSSVIQALCRIICECWDDLVV